MTSQLQKNDKTVAALIHLSTFSQFFFPFGNFFFPLLLWTARKNDPFVDEHGKQALNFQISLYLYMVFLTAVAFAGILLIGMNINARDPFFFNDHNFDIFQSPGEAMPVLIFGIVMAVLALGLFVFYVFSIITATIKAGEGKYYRYPLSINFLGALQKSGKAVETESTAQETASE